MKSGWDWIGRPRLVSGLVLFTYVASHLLNHALGVISLEAMEEGRRVFLAIWRNPVGTVVLYAALVIHIALVLYSIYRRRSLRMPIKEAVQIGLGLLIPPLLAIHIIGTRGLHQFFGVDDTYAFVIFILWVADPWQAVQQSVALTVVWFHGCMGFHFWLRLKPFYQAAVPYLYAAAIMLPLFALAGFSHAGRQIEALAADPTWFEALQQFVNWPEPLAVGWAYETRDAVLIMLAAILLVALVARYVREFIAGRRHLVTLAYPDGRRVTITPGLTILEASRNANIPHASVCGGRGRCSTCRVRVGQGLKELPAASIEELKVLERVSAPPDVRLACQTRPTADVEVTPLLPPTARPQDGFRKPAYLQGSEREIAIAFVDLRAFTKFSETKLPYDVVFVLNQYFRSMGGAIEEAGGRIDKFIGDGIMALFGVDSDPEAGCRDALNAARAMGVALDELNRTLDADLQEPLRMGIGIHIGPVVVGEMGYHDVRSVTAVGDTVNTASRLETMNKEFTSQAVISEETVRRAGFDLSAWPLHEVEVIGRSEPLDVYVIDHAAELPAAGAEAGRAAAQSAE